MHVVLAVAIVANEYVPAPQAVLVVVSGQKYPAPQFTQVSIDGAPTASEKVPASHTMQVDTDEAAMVVE